LFTSTGHGRGDFCHTSPLPDNSLLYAGIVSRFCDPGCASLLWGSPPAPPAGPHKTQGMGNAPCSAVGECASTPCQNMYFQGRPLFLFQINLFSNMEYTLIFIIFISVKKDCQHLLCILAGRRSIYIQYALWLAGQLVLYQVWTPPFLHPSACVLQLDGLPQHLRNVEL